MEKKECEEGAKSVFKYRNEDYTFYYYLLLDVFENVYLKFDSVV